MRAWLNASQFGGTSGRGQGTGIEHSPLVCHRLRRLSAGSAAQSSSELKGATVPGAGPRQGGLQPSLSTCLGSVSATRPRRVSAKGSSQRSATANTALRSKSPARGRAAGGTRLLGRHLGCRDLLHSIQAVRHESLRCCRRGRGGALAGAPRRLIAKAFGHLYGTEMSVKHDFLLCRGPPRGIKTEGGTAQKRLCRRKGTPAISAGTKAVRLAAHIVSSVLVGASTRQKMVRRPVMALG